MSRLPTLKKKLYGDCINTFEYSNVSKRKLSCKRALPFQQRDSGNNIYTNDDLNTNDVHSLLPTDVVNFHAPSKYRNIKSSVRNQRLEKIRNKSSDVPSCGVIKKKDYLMDHFEDLNQLYIKHDYNSQTSSKLILQKLSNLKSQKNLSLSDFHLLLDIIRKSERSPFMALETLALLESLENLHLKPDSLLLHLSLEV